MLKNCDLVWFLVITCLSLSISRRWYVCAAHWGRRRSLSTRVPSPPMLANFAPLATASIQFLGGLPLRLWRTWEECRSLKGNAKECMHTQIDKNRIPSLHYCLSWKSFLERFLKKKRFFTFRKGGGNTDSCELYWLNFWFHIVNLGKIPSHLIGRTLYFCKEFKFSFFESPLQKSNGGSKNENFILKPSHIVHYSVTYHMKGNFA